MKRLLAALAALVLAAIAWMATRDSCAAAWDAAHSRAAEDFHCAAAKITGGTEWAGCTVLHFEACGTPVEYSCHPRKQELLGVTLGRFDYTCTGSQRAVPNRTP